MLAVGRAEAAQLRDQAFTFAEIAQMAERQHHHLPSVHALGKEGQGRCLAGDHPHVEIVRHRFTEPREPGEHLLRLLERENNQPAQHLGAHRMELELEAGDDAEIATAPAQAPEEVCVFRFAGVQPAAIGRHHLGGEQVVDGHAMLAAQPAEATAQREAGDPGGRVDAHGRRQAMHLHGGIEISEGAAGLDAGPAGDRIDPHALHQ